MTCGVGEIIESRQCFSTISNDVVQPTVCGEDAYSFAHECLIDLCWDVVIQRRGQFGNPIEYFYRNWDEYVSGFGEQGAYAMSLIW